MTDYFNRFVPPVSTLLSGVLVGNGRWGYADPAMSIAVTGAYGQLGGELCRQLGAEAIPLDIDTLDLTDAEAVVKRMLDLEPEAIVNCAAYTQVDKAETEPQQCRAVNVAGAG